MATDLILSASEVKNPKPYKFETTNISVYSFEQAIYHCYLYWKESWDEIFIKDDFISWVRDELHLSFVASEIKKLRNVRNIRDKIISFLSIVYFFDKNELDELGKKVQDWQNQSQGEKLKEKGDSLIAIGSFEKAVLAYKAVLIYDKKNYVVMNNIGVGYMNMGKYSDAYDWFIKAFELCNDDTKNTKIIFNIIEACIYNDNLNEAENYINLIDYQQFEGEFSYFKGEIEFKKNNFEKAIYYYKRSVIKNDSLAIFRLADVYEKQGKYDIAIKLLDMFENSNVSVLIKKSLVYSNSSDLNSAIKCIQKALDYDNSSVELWTYLAKYYRLNNDFIKAEGAVYNALRLSSDDLAANLELAKIKRLQGKIKEHKLAVTKIFKNLKNEYRDIYF